MISASTQTASILTGSSWIYRVRVESWLNGVLLDDDVPIASGGEETDRTLRVPERVTLAVPRLKDGVSYAPIGDDHPLATNGQRLRILLGVGQRGAALEWLQRGWFVVQDSQVNGDQVDVTAAGLLALADEARLVSPFQPTGTIGATLRGLLEPAVTVDLTGAPTDRSVPSAVNFDEDRLQAVLDLLDAWAADATVNPDGVFTVVPAGQSTTAVATLSRDTTAERVAGGSTRDGAFNVVVARGTASDGGQVQGVSYQSTGPRKYGGPFNPLPVPYFFSSPLLTTVGQCNAAAATVLGRLNRSGGQRYTVEAVPDPRLQAGDVVELDSDDFHVASAAIEAISLPYTPSGGSMGLTVRAVP